MHITVLVDASKADACLWCPELIPSIVYSFVYELLDVLHHVRCSGRTCLVSNHKLGQLSERGYLNKAKSVQCILTLYILETFQVPITSAYPFLVLSFQRLLKIGHACI